MFALSDGNSIPAVGIGTWPLRGQGCVNTIDMALRNGYTLIDTAQMYNNETSVAEGIARSGVARSDIYITTKVAGMNQGPLTRRSIEDSLRRFNTDYLDLVLIHWPNPSQGLYIETFATMVHMQQEGHIRSVGVSNFEQEQLQAVYDATGVWPAVNQIQIDPWVQQRELRDFQDSRDIVTMAWGPFATRIARDVSPEDIALHDTSTLVELAASLNLTHHELIIAWLYKEGIVSIPRSSDSERQQRNLNAISIDITDEQLQILRGITPFTSHYRSSTVYEEW